MMGLKVRSYKYCISWTIDDPPCSFPKSEILKTLTTWNNLNMIKLINDLRVSTKVSEATLTTSNTQE